MARTTPRVEHASLVNPTDTARTVPVGSPDWYVWLTQATTFAFIDSSGRFTARKERGGRADGYWRAYRKHAGKVSIVYLGKSADLTLERLQEAAATLALAGSEHSPTFREAGLPAHRVGAAARPNPALPTDTVIVHRPSHLPIWSTPLIGREQDVAAVVAALHRAEVRLVTLTGPGGVGKTRLGLQAIAELSDAFSDGVFFVDLASIRDVAFVVPTIAQALGIANVDNQPLSTLLCNYLTARHLLLLLDNFEQVLPATRTLARLLADAPHIKLIVTSRAPLHLTGEYEYPVAPLPWRVAAEGVDRGDIQSADPSSFVLNLSSLPPAVALFIQRAQAVKPNFAVMADTVLTVEQICQRLDGLPLAIELAAVRIRLFSLAALLQLLDRRLPLLTGGAQDMPARHQTLQATIEWSYELLDERGRTLLQRLAVFEGGFTLDAVEAVCGDQEIEHSPSARPSVSLSIIDGLTTLVEQSLLRTEDDGATIPRFTMLDTIREYALERLELSQDRLALQHRHMSYYLRLAEQAEPELRGPNRRAWLDRLEAELPNLRAALAWAWDQQMVELAARLASALGVFWEVRHRREGRDWLEAVLESRASLSSTIHAKVLHTAGWLARAQRDQVAAIVMLEESMAVYGEVGDERGATAAMTDLGWTLATLGGDMPRAAALLEGGLAQYRAEGNQWGIAHALHGLGWLELHRARGDRGGIAWVLVGLGWVEQERGSLAKARALHSESLAIARAVRDAQAIAWSLHSLGVTAAAQGDYTAARTFQEERLTIERSQNNQHGMASTLQQLGVIAFRQGDHAAARAWLEESLELARAIGDKSTTAFALRGLGEVAYTAKDQARALPLLEDALAHFRELGDQHREAQMYALLAQIALDRQDDATAQSMASQSLKLARAVDSPETISACLAGMADSAARQGRAVWAAQLWGAAVRQGEDSRIVRLPAEPVERPQLIDAVRSSLGETAFAAARRAGYASTPEQVLAVETASELAPTLDLSFPPSSTSPRPAGLTQREFDVLLLVAAGLSNADIARRLVISIATVKTYLSAIYAKLGVSSRTAAMRYAIDHQIDA